MPRNQLSSQAKHYCARGKDNNNGGPSPAIHTCVIFRAGQNRIYVVYDCIFGEIPAKSTVHTPVCIHTVLAKPSQAKGTTVSFQYN